MSQSQFHASVLIPSWIVRDILMLVLPVLYAVFLALIVASPDTAKKSGLPLADTPRGEAIGILAANITIIFFCYVLDITAIILYSRRRLSAKVFFMFNAIQTALWTGSLILAGITVSKPNSRSEAILAFTVIIYILFSGILIYSFVVFRRDRKEDLRGDYEKSAPAEHIPRVQQSSLSVNTAYKPQQYNNPRYSDSNPRYSDLSMVGGQG